MSKAYVLVVDDEAWQCESYQRTLKKAGYAVRIAHTPEQAIDEIMNQPPQAIIMDMLLEGNTAFVLLHELQSDASLAQIPVIASTNLADQLREADLTGYGVRRLLDKSDLHPDDTVAAVRAVTL